MLSLFFVPLCHFSKSVPRGTLLSLRVPSITAIKMDICFFIITLYSFIIAGRHAGETAEILGEERGVGKVHLLSYLCRRFVRVAQFYFDASDEGTVYPVFGGGAAGLADDSGQVALGEAHTLGIVAYLVLFGTMLGDQLEETVEDSLLARL